MGYESALHLVNVKIKEASLPVVEKEIKGKKKSKKFDSVAQFLECVVVDEGGFLCFKPVTNFDSPYAPNEDDEGALGCFEGSLSRSARWLRDQGIRGH